MPKVNMSTPVKTSIVELDPSASPITKTPLKVPTFEAPSSCLDLELSIVPLIQDLATASHTFLRSESLAWNRFKTVVKEDGVMACYDMFVKEFEHSTVHDLYKVFFFVYNNLLILLPSRILTFCFADHVQVYGGI